MPQGLSVSRVVNVGVNFSPLPAATINFDSLMIVGDSDVINAKDRIRSYNDITAIAADFGTTAPEYLAAQLFFEQKPQPAQLYIGRWVHTATAGLLLCGPLTTDQQAINNWKAITTGSFKIQVDAGVATDVTGINMSGDANLDAVAATIQAAVRALAGEFAAVSVTWDSVYKQFVFKSGSTGSGSSVAALTAAATGADISVMLKGTAATMEETAQGADVETALEAVTALDQLKTQWYGLMFATPDAVDADCLAVAGYIEASSNPHIFRWTTSEAAALTTNDTTSIGYQLKQLGYERTGVDYSSSSPYASASFFGRAFTVDFTQNNSTIILAFKQEPGITAESLTASQADALDANNYTYFAQFNNNTAIIVGGKQANGFYFDEVWGVDWLANRIQTDAYNALYTSPTKIPQTDAGQHLLKTVIESSCGAGVNNGLLGTNLVWNGPAFGQINTGDVLPKGFYVYQPPISSQSAADRAARKSVPFQVAVNLAGGTQSVNISVNVNR